MPEFFEQGQVWLSRRSGGTATGWGGAPASVAALRLPPEIAFLAGSGVPFEALIAAGERAAEAEGAEQILLNLGAIGEEPYYLALAAHLGVPFYRGEHPLAEALDPVQSVLTGVVLLAPNALGLRAVLAPRGAALRFLLEATASGRLAGRYAICAPQRLASLVRARKGREIADAAAFNLARSNAEFSADAFAWPRQIIAALCLIVGAALAAYFGGVSLQAFAFAAFWAIFGLAVAVRLLAVAARCKWRPAPPLDDADLPIYSIVVPLFDEANSVERLVAALEAIDYPKFKLDIKIVVERRDTETLRAVALLGLPARYDVVVAPPGEPSTKPRALNVALPYVRGDYLVVFDAEDRPDPDQLRLAAARFAVEPRLDCLQARLSIDNPDETWVTKLFALEYAVLFDLVNPGLAALGAPMALGGTSNHFRASALRDVGGWDAWNLTEDADLGLRMAQLGRVVDFLESDTNEEAPLDLKSWFAQRTRWQKGWMQTLLVHSRRPLLTFRRLGLARFAFASSLILGGVLAGLFGPLLTGAAILRLIHDQFLPLGPGEYVVDLMTFALLLSGAQAIFIPAFVALRRRGLERLTRMIGALPLYFALISLASWAAVFDLAVRPHYWAKTEHGRARMRRGALVAARFEGLPPGVGD